jgi:hypothetical protein
VVVMKWLLWPWQDGIWGWHGMGWHGVGRKELLNLLTDGGVDGREVDGHVCV